MTRVPLLVLVVLVAAVLSDPVHSSSSASWSYSDQAGWAALFPQCGGARQSPVNLEPFDTHYWEQGGKPKLVFPKGLKAGQLTATNTGYTLQVELRTESGEPVVQLSGTAPGPLSGQYSLDNLHLHWNDPSGGRGSEHRMNGTFEEAEAHFVFFNQLYGGVSEALAHADGLAVLGLLLRPEPDLEGPPLPTLGLAGDLPQLAALGASVSRPADLRPLKPLLSVAINSLYSYEGSLTTPPCSPVVTWLVSDRPVSVGAEFLQQLRTSLYADAAGTEIIQNNWRELQDLDGRQVVRYTGQD